MAKVGQDVWKEFQEVNTLYEKGCLKDQNISGTEVLQGVLSMKQSHMKPLCALSDGQKLSLLRKVRHEHFSMLISYKSPDYPDR